MVKVISKPTQWCTNRYLYELPQKNCERNTQNSPFKGHHMNHSLRRIGATGIFQPGVE